MKMKHFEESPLYRFFNVLVLLGYAFVILVAIFAGFIGYSERDITSATVKCRDGTSWNALEPKNILYDSAALSGLCTNRNADGTYTESSYLDIDYKSYETEITKESWTWSTLIYPLIVFVIGFGLVDAVRLIVIYIFSGRLALEKSVLLRILVAMFASDQNANPQQDSFEQSYPLLLGIVNKEDVVETAKLLGQVEQGLKQAEGGLNNFYKKRGHDRAFFESNKSLDLDVDVLEEFYKLDNNFKDLSVANLRLSKYFQTLEEVNKHLENGEDVKDAKKRLQKLQEKDAEEIVKPQVQLEISKAIGEELLAMKKKYGKDFKDKKVNMDDILERVYEKHPGWRKTKTKKD